MGKRENHERRLQAIYGGIGGAIRRAVDGVVGTVAPGIGLGMRRSRLKASALLSYEAARINRNQGRSYSGSADAEALPDLQVLRDGSRAMVRDDAHAAAAVRVLEENTVGKGIVPQSTCTPESTGLSAEECEQWRKGCEAAWNEWADSADATNYGSFYDLQRIVVRCLMADGEGIGHLVEEDGQIYCELIDSDRLESPGMHDTDKIRGGVELGGRGQPVKYHFLQKHPADSAFGAPFSMKTDAVPANENGYSMVQHVFRRDRPGLTRGVPWLAAALPYNKHLHEYLSSELIAARVNSSVAMYVKRAPSADDYEEQPGSHPSDEGKQLQRMTPGAIEYLEEGEEIQPFTPNRPGSQFEPFVQRILRAIWASQGLSYELVSKDFGSMNYSSARSMLLECRRGFDSIRLMLIRMFCRPWFGNVIRSRVASGVLPAPRGFVDNPDAFLAARWIPPSYGWVDPVKEIEASIKAIEGNLSTHYDEAARVGGDAEQMLRKRGEFMVFAGEVETELGLPLGSLLGAAVKKDDPPPVESGEAKVPEEADDPEDEKDPEEEADNDPEDKDE